MNYQQFKANVLRKKIGDGQCVSLVVNNSQAYSEVLYPGVAWTNIFKPVPYAKDLFTDANGSYFTAIANDHNNPNQLPSVGDVMVFDATPQAGYSNTFNNPAGHAGICDSASAEGYTLLQQNSPSIGAKVNLTVYAWRFRPCKGWLHPVVINPQEHYTVVSGDTVSGISARFGLSAADDYLAFRSLNPQIPNIDVISVGQIVRVK